MKKIIILTFLIFMCFSSVNIYGDSIKELIKNKKYDEPEKVLLTQWDKEKTLNTGYMLGRILIKNEKFSEAVEILNFCRTKFNDEKTNSKISKFLKIAEEQLKNKKTETRFGGASWEIKEALKFVDQNKFEKAQEILDRVLKQDKENSRAIIVLALVKMLKKNKTDAMVLAKKALKIAPDDEFVMAYRAFVLFHDGQIEIAKSILEQAIKKNKKFPDTYRIYGIIFAKEGKFQDVLVMADYFLELESKNHYVYILKAVAYSGLGKFDDALKTIDKALDIDGKNDELWAYRGVVCLQAQDANGAINAFDKAISLNPRNVQALTNLGYIQMNMGQMEKAVEHLTQAKNADPSYELAYSYLAMIYLNAGELGKVKELGQELINVDENSPVGNNIFGRALLDSGKTDESIKYFEKVLYVNPNNTDALFNIGKALGAIQKFDYALDNFQKLDALLPGNQEVTMMLGYTYLQLGDGPNAKVKLNETVNLNPDSEFANQARMILQKLK